MTREEMKRLIVRLRRDHGYGVMSIARDYGIPSKTIERILTDANPNWRTMWPARIGGTACANGPKQVVCAYRHRRPNGGSTAVYCHPDDVPEVRARAERRYGGDAG